MLHTTGMADKNRLYKFKSLIDVIDTPGGHIATCVMIGCFGILLAFGAIAGWGWEDKRVELILKITAPLEAFLPIAAYAMRGTERANGKPLPPPEPKEPEKPSA